MTDHAMSTPDNYTMGHVALHYACKEDGPAAARLLSLLGFTETQCLPLPDGNFYRFVVDERHRARGDGIIYLSVVPEAQRGLVAAVREALRVGAADEHPSVGAMRGALKADPEYSFHFGVLVNSLERLEAMILDLRQRNATDPDLKGRLTITVNRAAPGNAEVDARLDRSPVYGDVTRYAYGKNGVQAFVETDLLTSGTLGESMVLEFDYVFPNHDRHILSVVELD